MNGTKDGGEMPQQSNQLVITIIVIAVAVNATVAVAALAWCLINKINPEAVLLTAFVGLTGTLFGYLGGMLSRTTPTASTRDAATTQLKPSGQVTVPEQQLETQTS